MTVPMTANAGISMGDKVWQIGDRVEAVDDRRLAGGFKAGAHGWYIVYVAGGDALATLALERRGWTVYRPMVARWVKVKQRGGLRADRTRSRLRKGKASGKGLGGKRGAPTQKRISVPLYPRYVFVAVDPRRGTWWNLIGIPGVAAVVRHNSSEVVRLGDAVIEGLRGLESRGVHDEETPPKALKLQAGTRVRVVAGPFASLDGVVVEGGDSETVVCELAVFGGNTPVSLPLDDVEALS